MAPLSTLPDRVRFQTTILIGQPKGSRYLEEHLKGLPGVTEASVNYRTGRILVVFDEYRIDVHTIKDHASEILERFEAGFFEGTDAPFSERKKNVFAGSVKQALFEAVAHAILPMPLNILVPVAMHTMKR